MTPKQAGLILHERGYMLVGHNTTGPPWSIGVYIISDNELATELPPMPSWNDATVAAAEWAMQQDGA